jgi:hypothetical protein
MQLENVQITTHKHSRTGEVTFWISKVKPSNFARLWDEAGRPDLSINMEDGNEFVAFDLNETTFFLARPLVEAIKKQGLDAKKYLEVLL